MGWLFGSSNPYPKEKHYIPAEIIKRLVSPYHVNTLSSAQAATIDQFIINAQHYNNGKISLYQIYEILRKLKNTKQISQQDRDGVIKAFVDYVKTHPSGQTW